MAEKIGRGLVARRSGQGTQLGTSGRPPTNSILLSSLCRRQTRGWETVHLGLDVENFFGHKIDPEEPTPLIDQVYSGCPQRESKTKESDVKSETHSCAKISTTDTQAKSKVKSLENRKNVSESNDMNGPQGEMRGTIL